MAGSILIAVLAVGATARAQDHLVLDRFQPAPAGDRFFGVEGADPGGHLLPRLMLLGDYAYRPLTVYQGSSDTKVGDVVSNRLLLHLAAGISLWDRLVVSVNVPLLLLTKGSDLSVGGQPFSPPSGMAVGSLRAGARVRLVGENRSIAALSLSGYVFIPTSQASKDKLASEDLHGTTALVLAGEDDIMAYAITAGVDLRKQGTFANTTTVGSQMTFGGAFGLLLADGMVQVGPEIYGTTVMTGSDSFSKATTNLEGILGARIRLGDMVLGLGAGPGITKGIGTPALRGVLSLAYAPLPPKPELPPPPPPPHKKAPPSDRDKDGIYDKDDACPDEPGVKDPDPTKNGCPPPPPDRDGDGILDRDDA
ncbi:MAG TPA: porin, partial [Polyangia bacterium]